MHSPVFNNVGTIIKYYGAYWLLDLHLVVAVRNHRCYKGNRISQSQGGFDRKEGLVALFFTIRSRQCTKLSLWHNICVNALPFFVGLVNQDCCFRRILFCSFTLYIACIFFYYFLVSDFQEHRKLPVAYERHVGDTNLSQSDVPTLYKHIFLSNTCGMFKALQNPSYQLNVFTIFQTITRWLQHDTVGVLLVGRDKLIRLNGKMEGAKYNVTMMGIFKRIVY